MAWTGAVSYAVAAAVAVLWLAARSVPIGWREVGYGAVGGLAWVGAYLSFNLGIRLAGVSITQCVAWLAVTVPVAAGILIWGETPTWRQSVGLALVVVALGLLVLEQPKGRSEPSRWRLPALVAAFLAEGANTLAMKAYTRSAPGADDSGLLLCMFVAAAAGMALAAARTEAKPRPGAAVHGTVLGAASVGANLAFMAAMRQLPAPVMFPSFWAGSVVLTAATAMVLWRERYRPRAILGMVLAVASMVLLHL